MACIYFLTCSNRRGLRVPVIRDLDRYLGERGCSLSRVEEGRWDHSGWLEVTLPKDWEVYGSPSGYQMVCDAWGADRMMVRNGDLEVLKDPHSPDLQLTTDDFEDGITVEVIFGTEEFPHEVRVFSPEDLATLTERLGGPWYVSVQGYYSGHVHRYRRDEDSSSCGSCDGGNCPEDGGSCEFIGHKVVRQYAPWWHMQRRHYGRV